MHIFTWTKWVKCEITYVFSNVQPEINDKKNGVYKNMGIPDTLCYNIGQPYMLCNEAAFY